MPRTFRKSVTASSGRPARSASSPARKAVMTAVEYLAVFEFDDGRVVATVTETRTAASMVQLKYMRYRGTFLIMQSPSPVIQSLLLVVLSFVKISDKSFDFNNNLLNCFHALGRHEAT